MAKGEKAKIEVRSEKKNILVPMDMKPFIIGLLENLKKVPDYNMRLHNFKAPCPLIPASKDIFSWPKKIETETYDLWSTSDTHYFFYKKIANNEREEETWYLIGRRPSSEKKEKFIDEFYLRHVIWRE